MRKILSRLTTDDHKTNFILLLIIFTSMILLSPKWNIGIFSFIVTSASLRYFRNTKLWKGSLFIFFVTSFASFIANQGVMPFPIPIMVPIILFLGIIKLIPLLLDKILYRRMTGILSIFIYPASSIIVDSFIANSPNGTFGNIAYSLVDFNALMQLASITGIWGIAFLIYLFAPVINHIIENYNRYQTVKNFSIGYGLLFSSIVIFGLIRLQYGRDILSDANSEKFGAVTSENTNWSTAVHKAVSGKTVILPKKIDQTSPQLVEFQHSLNEFIKDHNLPKYDSVYISLEEYYKEIFTSSQIAVEDGAKIILLSEGEIITFEDRESTLIDKAKEFALKNKVYFFFSMGTIYPEKMKINQPFIGNKILTISPEGIILDIYYKNVPVKDVDPSIPGDGIINVINTPYGNLSPVICYDADFPGLMRQTGEKDAEVVLVATGDWFSISPYHTKIGIVRAIENGVSMLKTVSNGLSVAVDPFGNTIKEDDFFKDNGHIMVADIPTLKINTLYTIVGDFVVYASYLYLIIICFYLVIIYLLKLRGGQSCF